MSGLKIAIVDDHQLFADALKNVLPIYGNIDSIDTFQNGHLFFTFLDTNSIDILLLDLGIKDGLNGFEILTQLKQRRPAVKVIVVSMHTQSEYIAKAKELGANGYVPKESGAAKLKDAIQFIMRKNTFYAPTLGLLNNPFNTLSPTENKIAKALINGMSNKEIAETLFRSKETIDTHRKNIYRKLEVSGVVEFIKLGVKHGMVSDAIE